MHKSVLLWEMMTSADANVERKCGQKSSKNKVKTPLINSSTKDNILEPMCPLFITFVVLIVMGRRRSLSTNERQRAFAMLQAGQSARRVAGTFRVKVRSKVLEK
jgi:hypothetical protein